MESTAPPRSGGGSAEGAAPGPPGGPAQAPSPAGVPPVRVRASAARVIALLADLARWPTLFEPVLHAEPAGESGGPATLWTRAGEDRAVRWHGTQHVRDGESAVDFDWRADGAEPRRLTGTWRARELAPERTELVLEPAAAPAAGSFLTPAFAGALRDRAEVGPAAAELVFTFQDTLRVQGPAAEVHAFLRDAGRWPGAVSHVASAEVRETAPGVQYVRSGIRLTDGGVQYVPSLRLVLPDRVVYKPLTVPAFASAHVGEWIVADLGDGAARLTGRHTVALRAERIAAAFGPVATPADARSRVRAALGAHSLTTLDAARAYAEAAGRVVPAEHGRPDQAHGG